MSDNHEMIQFRCRRHGCNQLLLNYHITGVDINLHLEGIEPKCEKCKRILQLRKYTEKMLMGQAVNGIFKV